MKQLQEKTHIEEKTTNKQHTQTWGPGLPRHAPGTGARRDQNHGPEPPSSAPQGRSLLQLGLAARGVGGSWGPLAWLGRAAGPAGQGGPRASAPGPGCFQTWSRSAASATRPGPSRGGLPEQGKLGCPNEPRGPHLAPHRGGRSEVQLWLPPPPLALGGRHALIISG